MATNDETTPAAPPEQDRDPLSDLAAGPWATLIVFLVTLVGGAVLIIGESEMTFEQWLQASLLASGALGVGRGLAYHSNDNVEGSMSAFDKVPWATVMVVLYSVIGAVVLFVGETALTYDDYMKQVLAGAAVLGLGRGIASLKRDHNMIDTEGYALERDALADEDPIGEEVAGPRSATPETAAPPETGAVGGKQGEQRRR